MKQALISPNEPVHYFDGSSGFRICEVVGQGFPVASPFFWEPVPDDVTADDYYWDGSEAKPVPVPPPPPPPTPTPE